MLHACILLRMRLLSEANPLKEGGATTFCFKMKIVVGESTQNIIKRIFNVGYMMEFISSIRGNKQLLVLDGYVYSEHIKLANNVVSWECINRRNARSCLAEI